MIQVSAICTALSGFGLAGLAAFGARTLQDFSHHDLEEFCLGKGNRDRLTDILDHHDEARLAAEMLALVGAVLAVSGWLGAMATPMPTPTPTDVGRVTVHLAAATFLLLLLVVLLPAGAARLVAAPFLYHTWPLWRLIRRLFTPLILIVGGCERLTLRLAGRQELEDEEEAFEDEIRTMVRAGRHEGLLEEDAQEMIEGVIELADTDVSDIMTPRSNVDALDVDLSWPEVLEFINRVRRTRIPVYESTLDNVVGVLYVKDLLPELTERQQPSHPLRELLREPWFVPETNAVNDMLQEFLKTRNHLAIVVDEYRAVAGVVTIEDVLEEIVGEIVDEFDPVEEDEIQVISGTTIEALGKAHLDDLNELLGAPFPEADDYDTIGGFLVSQMGRIPKAGETLTFEQLRITVLQSTRRRVERVRLVRQEELTAETSDAE